MTQLHRETNPSDKTRRQQLLPNDTNAEPATFATDRQKSSRDQKNMKGGLFRPQWSLFIACPSMLSKFLFAPRFANQNAHADTKLAPSTGRVRPCESASRTPLVRPPHVLPHANQLHSYGCATTRSYGESSTSVCFVTEAETKRLCERVWPGVKETVCFRERRALFVWWRCSRSE